MDAMTRLLEIRRTNLRRLAEQHTATALAQKLGYASASWISQMVGPRPVRDVTERTARLVEGVLDLEPGSLDLELEDITQHPQV